MGTAAMERPPRAAGGVPEAALTAYVEDLGHTLTDAGMPRLASRLFARLLADDDGRMTSAEITEALEVSAASVSGAVRYLTQAGLIGKTRERGSRRDVFVVRSDGWHFAMLSRDPLLVRMADATRAGVEAVGGTSTPAGRRLQLSVDFLEFLVDQMDGMREAWEARKAELTADWPDDDRS